MTRPATVFRGPALPLVCTLFVAACSTAPAKRTTLLGHLPTVSIEELGVGPDIEESPVAPVAAGLLGEVDYDLPLEANTWVEAELDYLVRQRRSVIERWMNRGDFYEAYLKETLAAYGLPTDLYHLAMIESGFQPTVRSRAGAVGLWQFMPATGRMEGLRVDSIVDERMDPVRSTHAAARHLTRLHRQYRNWPLAAAAYNAGSGRISRGMQNFAVDNFWDLAVHGDLADETKHYVPRLYAMTIIARDRPRFGFAPPGPERERFAYDSLLVDLETPLSELAAFGEVSLEELTRFNPHLIRGTTPSGPYWVWAPPGRGEALQQAFLDSDFRRGGGYAPYTVRRGDSLGGIAQAAGVPAARIRDINPGVDFDRLRVGARLRLPRGAAQALSARPQEPDRPEASRGAASAAAGSKAGSEHRVREGDSLWLIARRYGVSVEALKKENGMNGETVVIGRMLRIPGGEPAPAAAPTAKSREHVVQAGETLWGIARSYGTSVEALRELNAMQGAVIRPGQKIRVPA
jgi:membrane-bound lytic murein transglycosylase D